MLGNLFNLEFATDKDFNFTHRKPSIIALSCLGGVILLTLIIWYCFFASHAIKYEQASRIVATDSTKAQELIDDVSWDYRDTVTLRKYISAVAFKDNEQYAEAIPLFISLRDYKDSKTLLGYSRYYYAEQLFQQKDYQAAHDMFQLAECKDYGFQANRCYYTAAVNSNDNYTAAMYMKEIFNYSDAEEKYKYYMFSYANDLLNSGEKLKAAEILKEFHKEYSYENSVEFEHKLWYELALDQAEIEEYFTAFKYISNAVDYPSVSEVNSLSREYLKLDAYYEGVRLMNEEKFDDALSRFESISGFKDADELALTCEKILYKWEFDGFLSTDGTKSTETSEFMSDDDIYIVGTLSGGRPEKVVDLIFIWTDCKGRKSTCTITEWKNHNNGGCYFSYSHPKNADSGKSKITVSIVGEDDPIATFEFNITVNK